MAVDKKSLVAEGSLARAVIEYNGNGKTVFLYECMLKTFPKVPRSCWVEWEFDAGIPGAPANALDICKRALIEVIGDDIYEDMDGNGLDMIFEWLIGYSDGSRLKVGKLIEAIKKVNPKFKAPKLRKNTKSLSYNVDSLCKTLDKLSSRYTSWENNQDLCDYFFELMKSPLSPEQWDEWLKTGTTDSNKLSKLIKDSDKLNTGKKRHKAFVALYPCFDI